MDSPVPDRRHYHCNRFLFLIYYKMRKAGSISMKITIARQCGSGGHKVADILSEKLGMEIFDKKDLSKSLKEETSMMKTQIF